VAEEALEEVVVAEEEAVSAALAAEVLVAVAPGETGENRRRAFHDRFVLGHDFTCRGKNYFVWASCNRARL